MPKQIETISNTIKIQENTIDSDNASIQNTRYLPFDVPNIKLRKSKIKNSGQIRKTKYGKVYSNLCKPRVFNPNLNIKGKFAKPFPSK